LVKESLDKEPLNKIRRITLSIINPINKKELLPIRWQELF